MKVFDENTFTTAWFKALKFLNEKGNSPYYNLLIYVENPANFDDKSEQIIKITDTFLKQYSKSLHNVAETIFPAALYYKYGWKKLQEKYLELYPEIKTISTWGTYAHRMLFRQKSDNTEINPLDICLEKLKKIHNRKPKTKAAYEINILDENLDLQMYCANQDKNRIIGGPCLSHISLKLDLEKKLYLTALYRSHFYVERALGNLIGLLRLQEVLCKEANLSPGPLVCMSTYAQVDYGNKSPWKKSDVDRLIEELDNIF